MGRHDPTSPADRFPEVVVNILTKILIWPLVQLLTLIVFILDCIVAAVLYGLAALGIGQPNLFSIVRFAIIIGLSFFLAVWANRNLSEGWSDTNRLSTPLLIESASTDSSDGTRISYGFEVRGSENTGSFFRVLHDDETLFELTVESELRSIERNGIFDPDTCFSMYVPLPSRIRTRERIEDNTEQLGFEVNQSIYEICRFGWPFVSVVEPSVELDRLSLVELLRQEFDEALAVVSSADTDDPEATEGEDSAAEPDAEAEGGIDEIAEELIREVFIGQFLAAQGILGQQEMSVTTGESGIELCAQADGPWSGFCRSVLPFTQLFSWSTDGGNLDATRCGRDESLLDRICDTQSAMFPNGRIQFVSLLVFFFGLLQLGIVFALGIVTPTWVRLVRRLSRSWSDEPATVVTQFVNAKRYDRIYPEVSAPVVAAVDILPMIGFFGTIVGISGAMTEVAGVKSSDPIVEVLSLGSMTTNIGIAFETTKFALILSAILLLLKLLTDRLQALSSEEDDDVRER